VTGKTNALQLVEGGSRTEVKFQPDRDDHKQPSAHWHLVLREHDLSWPFQAACDCGHSIAPCGQGFPRSREGNSEVRTRDPGECECLALLDQEKPAAAVAKQIRGSSWPEAAEQDNARSPGPEQLSAIFFSGVQDL
jgi:hypothetical protein